MVKVEPYKLIAPIKLNCFRCFNKPCATHNFTLLTHAPDHIGVHLEPIRGMLTAHYKWLKISGGKVQNKTTEFEHITHIFQLLHWLLDEQRIQFETCLTGTPF